MSRKYHFKKLLQVFATGALAGICSSLWASAFQIQEQNVTNLGFAYAGTAALAEDASTNFYNSAGLTRLCNEELVLSGVLIVPYQRLDSTTSTTTTRNPFSGNTTVLLPNGSTKVRGTAFVPSLHYFHRLDCDWVFGLSLTSPFGLRTTYKTDEVARYFSTKADLITYDIVPSIAYCLGNGFSIGIGADILYAEARLHSRTSFTGIIDQDGFQRNRISRWGYGGHIGLMYDICDTTRIGLNYRSEVKIRGRGELISTTPALPIARVPVAGPEFNQRLRADFTLPDTGVLSLYHQLDDCWAVVADAQWTHWNKIQDITLRSDDNRRVIFDLKFRDTWRFALGTSYQYDCNWLFRLGAAYDQSPVRNAYRTAAIPDSDRVWLGVGGRYRFDKCFALEFGYAHLFFKNATINEPAPRSSGFTLPPSQRLAGRYRSHADLVGIQLTWDLL